MTLIIHFHTAKVRPFSAPSKHFPNFSLAIWRHPRQTATPLPNLLQICRVLKQINTPPACFKFDAGGVFCFLCQGSRAKSRP